MPKNRRKKSDKLQAALLADIAEVQRREKEREVSQSKQRFMEFRAEVLQDMGISSKQQYAEFRDSKRPLEEPIEDITEKKQQRPGLRMCQKADETIKEIAAISSSAMKQIESEIDGLGFPLDRIAFSKGGHWSMQFDRGDDPIEVRSAILPSPLIAERHEEWVSERDLQIKIYCYSDRFAEFTASGRVDEALAKLKAFLKHH